MNIYKTMGIRILSAMLLLSVLSFSIIGCGSDEKPSTQVNATEKAIAENDVYIAEIADMPHENIVYVAVHQNTLYYLNQKLPGDTSQQQMIFRMDMESGTQDAAAIPLVMDEGQSLSYMVPDGNGALHIVIYCTDAKDVNVITDVLWMRLDEAGNVSSIVSLYDFYQEQGNQLFTGFQVDVEGNSYIAINKTIFVMDPDGNLLYQTECVDTISFLGKDGTGKIYVIWVSTAGNALYGMAEVDSETKSLGAKADLPISELLIGIGAGAEGNITLASTSGVYDYNIKDKTTIERFQWSALDVAADYYGQFLSLTDGRVLWLDREYQADNSVQSSLTIVRPQLEGESIEKTQEILTFGGVSMFIDAAMREAVVNFNRSNSDYRIEIVEYGAEDVVAGMEQLNTDIISGNCPDIMALPIGSSMHVYSEKGILEDLNPYLDADSSVGRADLQENILAAFEMDGKLYGLPITYAIYTTMGRKALLEGHNSWNLDEMIDFYDQYGGDSQLFANASKSGVLNLCIAANYDIIVDWNDSENGFDRDFFIKTLEFANQFTSDDQFVIDSMDMLFPKISDGQIQIYEMAIANVMSHQLMVNIYGEPITYMGYPSENGNGSMVGSSALVAISSQCADKEAAWQFVSSMLAADFQESETIVTGFPLRRSGLEKQLERAMEATYTTDENGNQQEVPLTSAPLGQMMIEIYAAKEEEVQAIRDLIEGANKVIESDNQINSILAEEAQTYFSGSKSADEVADIAENRIRLYVNEIK